MPSLDEPRPRVLVAEDDDSLRRLLEIRLGNHGFDVRSASDGVAALEIAEDWVPDVALLDVMMPRLSGLSVCRELRARPATTMVPVLLLTARWFDEDIQAVVSLGGVEYMSKPFDFGQLEETLALLCGRLTDNGPRVVRLSEGSLS